MTVRRSCAFHRVAAVAALLLCGACPVAEPRREPTGAVRALVVDFGEQPDTALGGLHGAIVERFGAHAATRYIRGATAADYQAGVADSIEALRRTAASAEPDLLLVYVRARRGGDVQAFDLAGTDGQRVPLGRLAAQLWCAAESKVVLVVDMALPEDRAGLEGLDWCRGPHAVYLVDTHRPGPRFDLVRAIKELITCEGPAADALRDRVRALDVEAWRKALADVCARAEHCRAWYPTAPTGSR